MTPSPSTDKGSAARPPLRATAAWLGAGSGLVAVFGWPLAAHADWALNMSRGVTPISREVFDLHMLILWICVIIAVVVFGAMGYSIVKHRRHNNPHPAQFHHSTFAEFAWTIVPCIILIAMAWPATKALINIEDTSEADLTIKVTGYQWKWRYEYVGKDVDFYSNLALDSRREITGDPSKAEHYLLNVDEPLVLPVGKKVRFLLTADDVIHAWWVPALGMKRDAIPGFVNEMWARIDEPGVYRGQCAELCGRDHGFMPIVVIAKEEAEYGEWLAAAQTETTNSAIANNTQHDTPALMARGEQVYANTCAACHQANGEGVPHVFPAIKGSAVATGNLDDHLNIVLNGKAGTAMNGFGALQDIDLAAVITYQRNAFGNATGDAVQPRDIRAARSLATADGSLVAADGSLVAADGALVAADGSLVAADGSLVAADGSAANAVGAQTELNSTTSSQSGS